MPIFVTPEPVPASAVNTPGTVLHAGQVTLGGITLGVVDGFGVEWVLESLRGWFDSPSSTGGTEQRAADHGGWLAPAFYEPRILEVEGAVVAADWASVSEALDRLGSAIPLDTPAWLVVDEGARSLRALVRQEGDPLVERSGGWARFSLSLVAPDPRRYSTEVSTVSTGLPQSTGGLSLPVSLPVTVGATVSAGVLSVTNAGNMGTRPVFTVAGPAPAFTVTHRGTGRVLRVHEAVPAGRTLVIDTDKRSALLDGSPRLITGTWFEYAPGLNEVAFSSATYESSALLVSTHRSAWR